jgi:hypothetical protein
MHIRHLWSLLGIGERFRHDASSLHGLAECRNLRLGLIDMLRLTDRRK